MALICILLAFIITARAEDCFYNKRLTYIYNQPDYSGNYTSCQEYWLQKDENCTFIVSTNTKLTWYSSDIDARYLMYYDNGDGSGCRTKSGDDFQKYDKDIQIFMGTTKTQKDNACLVKYEIANNNKVHDLRL